MKYLLVISLLIFSASSSGQSRKESAQSVMNSARSICEFTDTSTGLIVTCPQNISKDLRFGFATAIANADTTLNGKARRIDFRLDNGDTFAEANPNTGIREITRSPQSPTSENSSPHSINVGTLADTVLASRGKASSVKQVGRDDNGLLIEWHYSDATYLMGRRLQGGIEAYRVIKITPR